MRRPLAVLFACSLLNLPVPDKTHAAAPLPAASFSTEALSAAVLARFQKSFQTSRSAEEMRAAAGAYPLSSAPESAQQLEVRRILATFAGPLAAGRFEQHEELLNVLPLKKNTRRIFDSLRYARPFNGKEFPIVREHPLYALTAIALYILQESTAKHRPFDGRLMADLEGLIQIYNEHRGRYAIATPPLTIPVLFSYAVSMYAAEEVEHTQLELVENMTHLPAPYNIDVAIFHLYNQSAHELEWAYGMTFEEFDLSVTGVLMNFLFDQEGDPTYWTPERRMRFERSMLKTLWQYIRFEAIQTIILKHNPAIWSARLAAKAALPGFRGERELQLVTAIGTWIMDVPALSRPADQFLFDLDHPDYERELALLLQEDPTLTRSHLHLGREGWDNPLALSPLQIMEFLAIMRRSLSMVPRQPHVLDGQA